MKNVFIFFMCTSFLFSCIKDEDVYPKLDGSRIISFVLGPRTNSINLNVIEPIESKTYRIHVVQNAENLEVLFHNKTTGNLEFTFVDDKLKVEGLRQICQENEELKFMYPDGMLTVHFSSGSGIWMDLNGG